MHSSMVVKLLLEAGVPAALYGKSLFSQETYYLSRHQLLPIGGAQVNISCRTLQMC